jgi:hypothetical protein
MKKSIYCLSAALAIFVVSYAQEKSPANGANQADLGFGIGSSQANITTSYQHDWKIGKKKNFSIGTGARFTSYFGKDIAFLSAPASLANVESSTDTLLYPSPSVNALNVFINLGVTITPKLTAGFNIDVTGFSFGKNSNATFTGSGITQATTARPTGLNLLLVGNNDKGSLNSQFYLKYLVSQHVGIKVAYQYLFTEVATNTKVQVTPEQNDRFRNKASMGYLGITYNF